MSSVTLIVHVKSVQCLTSPCISCRFCCGEECREEVYQNINYHNHGREKKISISKKKEREVTMGRKKIQITRIMDERNRQVS